MHILSMSQLNLKLTSEYILGNFLLSACTIALPPHVVLDDASNGPWLKFNWTVELPPCNFTIFYNIFSVNCGICPNTTNQTTATCLDLQLSTSAILCTFTVESVVCGSIRSPSNTVIVTVQGMYIHHCAEY